jgi:hypothetical protein
MDTVHTAVLCPLGVIVRPRIVVPTLSFGANVSAVVVATSVTDAVDGPAKVTVVGVVAVTVSGIVPMTPPIR